MDDSTLPEKIEAAKAEAERLLQTVEAFSIEEDYCRRYDVISQRVEALKIRYAAMLQARGAQNA